MRNKYKNLVIVIILGSIIFNCFAKKSKMIINNKKDYKKYIEDVRKGMLGETFADKKNKYKFSYLSYREDILHSLLEYIKKNKERLYKNNEEQWLYDIAMISLINRKYYSGLKFAKEYIAKTNNIGKILFHIGLNNGTYNRLAEIYFIRVALKESINNKNINFSFDESMYLIKTIPDYSSLLYLNPLIEKDIKETNDYKKFYNYYLNYKNDIDDNYQNHINDFNNLDIFPIVYLNELKNKQKNDDEIIFLFEYYLNKLDYKNAAKILDQYGVGRIYDLSFFGKIKYCLPDAPLVYYMNKEYKKVIEVYESNIDNKEIDDGRSNCSNALFAGASYAGLGKYDKAIEYLKKALNESVIEPEYKTSYSKPFLLSTLFYLVFSEEYDKLKDVGRYDEVDQLAEASLERYQHLFKFGPEYKEYK